MYGNVPYDLTQGQGHETLKVRSFSIFQLCFSTIYSGSWQVTRPGQYLHLFGSDFLYLS